MRRFSIILIASIALPSAALPPDFIAIASRASHVYTETVLSGQTYLVKAEHEGVDITLSVQTDVDLAPTIVDIPLATRGLEYAVVESDTANSIRIIVASGEGNYKGRYRLSIEPLEVAYADGRRKAHTATSSTEDIASVARLHNEAIAQWASTGDINEQARLHFSLGSRYARANELVFARESYMDAARLWRQRAETNLDSNWSRYRAAVQLVRLRKISEARQEFEDILPGESQEGAVDPQLEGAARNYVALTYLITGDIDTARNKYFSLAPFLSENKLYHQLATVQHNIGSTYYEQGEPREAMRYFEQAINTALTENPEANISGALEEIAGLYYLMGRCDQTFVKLDEAMQHLNRRSAATGLTASSKRAEGRILNRMGNCYRALGDNEAAIDLYQRSLSARGIAKDIRGAAYTKSNLGNAYRNLGLLERALPLHSEASQMHKDGKDMQGYVTSLTDFAYDLLALERHEEVLETAEEIEKVALEMDFSGFVARATLLQGMALAGLKNWSLAAAKIKEARGLLIVLSNELGELEARQALAELMVNQERWRDAKNAIAGAFELAERIRSTAGSEDLRASFSSLTSDLHHLQLFASIQVAKKSGKENLERAFDEALVLNNKRRSRVLREELLLAVFQDDSTGGAVTAYRDSRDEINAKLSKRDDMLRDKNSASTGGVTNDILEQRLGLLASESKLAQEHPQWRKIVQPPVLDLEGILASLPRHRAVVDFSFGSRSTYAWIVTRGNITGLAFDGSPVTRSAQQDSHYQRVFLETVRRLKQDHPDVDDLYVLPDGHLESLMLAGLPFQGKSIVDHYAVTLRPSLTSLGDQPWNSESAVALSLVGDPVYRADRMTEPKLATLRRGATRLSGIRRLPYSGEEVRNIAKIASPLDVSLLTRYAATKAGALEQIRSQRDIFHVAAHGLLDPTDTALSGLAFAQLDEQGNDIDGFLSISEIYGLGALDVRMIVLSACQSGRGKQIEGEGAASLARAFLQNGVAYVIASQSDVDDGATAALMTEYYRLLLKKNQSPARALAEAQRKVRKNRRWRAPEKWASFVLWSVAPD